MTPSLIRPMAAVALAVAMPLSMAQTRVALVGTSSDGLAVNGYIDANFSAAASLQETLADGTLHTHFTLLANGPFDSLAGWHIGIGPSLAFHAFDDGYAYNTSTGPEVDAYLTPDGRSSLRFDWAVRSPCHGGCVDQGTLHLELRSDTASLFGAQLDSSAFSRYTAGTGHVSDVVEYFAPPGTYTKQSSFTLGAVPEPQAALLGALGLSVVLLAKRLTRI